MYSFDDRADFMELEPLKASLRARLNVPTNFNVEYLDSTRLDGADYRKSLSETLYQAYNNPKPDLIVVGAYPALRFVLDFREQMFLFQSFSYALMQVESRSTAYPSG